MAPAMEGQSLNLWTAREVPKYFLMYITSLFTGVQVILYCLGVHFTTLFERML